MGMEILKFFEDMKVLVDPLAAIGGIAGLYLALAAYRKATKKEQLDRERGTYDSLDAKYLDFLRLSIQHPELDLFERPLPAPPELSDQGCVQQLAAFAILLSIFERAYLLFKDETDGLRARQWAGWQGSMSQYAERGNFREAWRLCGDGFDTAFQTFLQNEYNLPAPYRQTASSHP